MRLAVCAEMVLLDLPFEQRVQRLTELGYGVVLWDWRTKDVDALEGLRESGTWYSSMTGYAEGALADDAGAERLLATARDALAVAERLGVERLNVHGTGLDGQGLPVVAVDGAGATPAMWLRAARTREALAALGEAHQQVFVLENLNTAVDHPGVPFARAAETLALVEAVGSPWLKLNLDLYHAQIGEGNLVDLIRRAVPHVGEVQVADVPGRCEPGTGEVRWSFVAQALADAGYDGTVAMEAFAIDPSVEGSDRALDAFRTAFTV